jgi:hypothetical protein
MSGEVRQRLSELQMQRAYFLAVSIKHLYITRLVLERLTWIESHVASLRGLPVNCPFLLARDVASTAYQRYWHSSTLDGSENTLHSDIFQNHPFLDYSRH